MHWQKREKNKRSNNGYNSRWDENAHHWVSLSLSLDTDSVSAYTYYILIYLMRKMARVSALLDGKRGRDIDTNILREDKQHKKSMITLGIEMRRMHSFHHCFGLYFSSNPYFCPLFIYLVDFYFFSFIHAFDSILFFSFYVFSFVHWFGSDFGCCCRYTVCSCSTLNLFLNVVTCTQSQAQSHSIEMKEEKKEFGRFHKRHPFFLTNMSCDILFLIHKLEDELIAYKGQKRHAIIFRTIFFFLFFAIHKNHFHQLNRNAWICFSNNSIPKSAIIFHSK